MTALDREPECEIATCSWPLGPCQRRCVRLAWTVGVMSTSPTAVDRDPHPRFRVSISTPDITATIYLNPNIPGDTERLTSPILGALTDLERTALLTQLIGQVVAAHREWGVA